MMLKIALGLLLFGAPQEPPAPGADAFDFLVGEWTSVKDGMSLTTEVRPILDGLALQETQIADENNRVVATAILAFDASRGRWTRTWFDRAGRRSTFVGKAAADETVALEQVSFDGRAIDPPASRLVYTPRGDGFVLDWQSRAEASASTEGIEVDQANEVGEWIPRAEPFVHERVDRPDPPGDDGRIAFISNRDGNWEIYTMTPDGSDVRNLTTHPQGDHFPRWIAGGSRLSFRSQRDRDDGAWDRFEIDLDGTDARKVPMLERLSNPSFGEFPELHPSGSWAINAVERDGDLDLYVWRYDGGGERVVAPAKGNDYRARFSPDGSRILFISERDGNPEVYTVRFDGSDVRRLTDHGGLDRYAQWSPDGKRIAFASDRDAKALEIWVMDADGSNARRLTNNDVEDGEISWSPDGTRLVYRSDQFGNSEVCVVDIESGEITNLSKNAAYDAEPVWSP